MANDIFWFTATITVFGPVALLIAAAIPVRSAAVEAEYRPAFSASSPRRGIVDFC